MGKGVTGQPPRVTLNSCYLQVPAMANLTLCLDDGLLQKAREAVLRERTSVNALVREYLIRYVDAKQRRLEALDVLDKLSERSTSRSVTAWTRESLHECDPG